MDALLPHQGYGLMDALLHHQRSWIHYYIMGDWFMIRCIIRGQMHYYVRSWMHYYILGALYHHGLWIDRCMITSSAVMDVLLHHRWLIHHQMHFVRYIGCIITSWMHNQMLWINGCIITLLLVMDALLHHGLWIHHHGSIIASISVRCITKGPRLIIT